MAYARKKKRTTGFGDCRLTYSRLSHLSPPLCTAIRLIPSAIRPAAKEKLLENLSLAPGARQRPSERTQTADRPNAPST